MACMHINAGMRHSAVSNLITLTPPAQKADFNESETASHAPTITNSAAN